MLNHFNKVIGPKVLQIAEQKIHKESSDIITSSFDQQLLDDHDLSKIVILNKNKDNEIVAVDFNLEAAYEVVLDVAKNIKTALEKKDQDHNLKGGYIIYVPIGIGTENIYFANVGPKLPVKIEYISTLTTSLKTRVKDYGINNSLIEVYMTVSLKEQIIIPFSSKKVNNECEILLSSQIVEGIVPSIYGGLLEKNSSLINVPIEE